MKDLNKFLTEWTKIYIKNKDIINKSIENIKEEKNTLIVKHKDKEEFYIIEPFIKDIETIQNKLDKEKTITLVIFNSKENFDIIIKHWKGFIDLKNFKICFCNPFSETDKKWIISPYMHHKISDESSLKLGLKSMFDSVANINENSAKQEIQNQKEFI